MTMYKARSAAVIAGLGAAVILGLLVTVSLAAPPPGKGNGGGGDSGSTLPDDLDVRYRVQYIPLPAGFTGREVKDVSDAYQVVGWYDFGAIRTGSYYDALTGAMLTASDMVDLPAEWVSTNFIGINNHGAIVGHCSPNSRESLICGSKRFSKSWQHRRSAVICRSGTPSVGAIGERFP